MATALYLLGQLGTIFYTVVLPVVLVAATGYLVQSAMRLDLQTLTTLQFYCLMPAVIFFSIISTDLDAAQAGLIVAVGVALVSAVGLIAAVVVRVARVPRDRRNAAILSAMMHNSGNFGLPMQRLAFAGTPSLDLAVSMQSFLLVAQSLMSFSVGVVLASRGERRASVRETLRQVLRLPPLYALAAGLLVVRVRGWLGPEAVSLLAGLSAPLWRAVDLIRSAFIGVVLFTLGAQLAEIRTERADSAVLVSVLLRLPAAPLVSYAIIRLLGIGGIPARILLIGTTTPTAVNALLFCMRFDNNPRLVAQVVLLTTLPAPITVTVVIYLAPLLFP